MAETTKEVSFPSPIQPEISHKLFAYAHKASVVYGLYNLDKRCFDAVHHPGKQRPTFLEQYDWKEIHLSFDTPYFALIPAAEYAVEKANNFLATLFDPLPDGEIIDYPTALGAHIFVGLREENNANISAAIPHIQHTPAFANFVVQHQALQLNEGAYVGLHRFETSFLLCILNQGKLQLLNHFLGNSPEDALYFTSLALRELAIEPKETHVVCSGTDIAATQEFLSAYYKKVHRVSDQLAESPYAELCSIPEHTDAYPQLILAPLCA